MCELCFQLIFFIYKLHKCTAEGQKCPYENKHLNPAAERFTIKQSLCWEVFIQYRPMLSCISSSTNMFVKHNIAANSASVTERAKVRPPRLIIALLLRDCVPSPLFLPSSPRVVWMVMMLLCSVCSVNSCCRIIISSVMSFQTSVSVATLQQGKHADLRPRSHNN